MKKHYNFKTEEGSGRFAVAITDDGRFILRRITGKAPPIEVIYYVCRENPEVLEKGHQASLKRKHDFYIESHAADTGARATYRLRYCRDNEIADYPYAGRIHVSMYGKLNAGIEMCIGDFYEISKKVLLDYEFIGSLEVQEAAIPKIDKSEWVSKSTSDHPFMPEILMEVNHV